MKLSLLLLLSFRLFLSVTATATTATAAVAAGSEVASEEVIRVLLRKYAKKTAHVDEIKDSHVCSIDRFPLVAKYQNCQGVESVVDILCAVPPRRRTCKYTEHYINRKGEECRVEGSFDPIWQIGTDPARPDVCQLDFVSLKDSCSADAVPGFGMKAEVRMKTGHEEEDACTSSLMLLRFSVTGGAEYYNDETPRTAIALECALPTTAVVEEERGIVARTSSARPTQCTPEYHPATDYCYSKQNANAVDYCWLPGTYVYPGNHGGEYWKLTSKHGDNNCGPMCRDIWEYRAHTSDHCWKDTRNAGKYCWSTTQIPPYPMCQWERSYDNGDNNCGQYCTKLDAEQSQDRK